jgi:DNA-binding transcriptional MerR regulator
MLTISQLARFTGVTVRAVRHYHQRGLLPEPDRDNSGYRRYGVQAVVDLIRIKTLAEAGVPLSRVSELLDADPGQFARAVDEIDRDLRARARELQRHRQRVASLVAGDGLVLPKEATDYLHLLRDRGVSERSIALEREGWIILAATWPDHVVEWTRQKAALFEDEEFQQVYLAFDGAFDWSPDDPRLEGLADTVADLLKRLATQHSDEQADYLMDDDVVALLDSHSIGSAPAWRRLGTLLEARGWSGWNQGGPTDS